LIPVIEAARITQGLVQFYTPNLNTDPESTHDAFLLMADMGGGVVCWATPASLIKDAGQPVTDGRASGPRSAVDAVSRPLSESTSLAPSATKPQTDVKPESPPAPDVARRSRTRERSSPGQ
jgi:hypothetical protein